MKYLITKHKTRACQENSLKRSEANTYRNRRDINCQPPQGVRSDPEGGAGCSPDAQCQIAATQTLDWTLYRNVQVHIWGLAPVMIAEEQVRASPDSRSCLSYENLNHEDPYVDVNSPTFICTFNAILPKTPTGLSWTLVSLF